MASGNLGAVQLLATSVLTAGYLLINRRSRTPVLSPSDKRGTPDANSACEPELEAAWANARDLIGSAEIEPAQRACERYLTAIRGRALLDPADHDLSLLIRRHVPALVQETRALMAFATANARDRLKAELVANLMMVAVEAEARTAAIATSTSDRLRVRQLRFASQFEGRVPNGNLRHQS